MFLELKTHAWSSTKMNQQLRKLSLSTSFWSQFFSFFKSYLFLTSTGLVPNFFRQPNSCPDKALTISGQIYGMVRRAVLPWICSDQNAILNLQYKIYRTYCSTLREWCECSLQYVRERRNFIGEAFNHCSVSKLIEINFYLAY